MTAIFLQNELQSLIQEAKRKSPETRTAAEKSLADLKGLSVTSESQLSGDLVRKPQFIDPFVFACRSRNVKLATNAINCLQRLAAGRAIPRDRLSDVLDALREIAVLSLDVQLKILQTLPALLQLYSNDIRGQLLAVALEICDALQGSKTAMVSSTAEATFQQLVTTVYDRVSTEDGQPARESSQSIQVGTKTIVMRPAAHDAFRVFADLCAMVNATEPTFIQLKTSSPHFLLEVIGSIAKNYNSIIARHPEHLEVCRLSLLPALTKIMAMKSTFAVLVRALRILYVLLRQHLQDMVSEFEDGLLLMISLLESNSSQPWRRVLCMEVFRGLCSDASLFRDLYRLYDDAEDRKNVVGDLLAAFVRIASEDPTLIGLGRQSTMPSQHDGATGGESITSFEASDIGGAVGGVVSASATVTGLSTEWSTVKVQYLENLDKSDLSDIPTTYIYSLVLNCISALAEGMSRFVMPLSVPSKVYNQRTKFVKASEDDVDEESHHAQARSTTATQNQNRLINPLTLNGHPQFAALSSCARMLDKCWPPILATCSTFFNAALDAEYYHNLVRAFQKLTQVSGVLELSTARDAFLTTLSKAAISSSTNARLFSPSTKQSIAPGEAAPVDAAIAQTLQSAVPRDNGQPRLSVRNLLCLRALLNLGIALGPSLGTDAWFIILETLKRAEFLILSASTLHGRDDAQLEERLTEQGGTRTLFSVETAAVQTATKRMFESTSSYTDETFALFVTSLFKLDPAQDDVGASSTMLSPTSPTGSPLRARVHRASRSISALWTGPETLAGDQGFVISKISELTPMNMHRFLSPESSACSWQLLVQRLLEIFASRQSTAPNRLRSAGEVDAIVLEVVKACANDNEEPTANATTFKHCFDALTAQLDTIQGEPDSSETELSLSRESHAKLLATLEVIIGNCGDTLMHEWTNVLKLISSAFVFSDEEHASNATGEDLRITETRPRSDATLQRSFACLQLIVSDFLSTLQSGHLKDLTMLLFHFGSQTMLLNISLTATTLFWNVSALLLDKLRTRVTGPDSGAMLHEAGIADTRKTFLLLFSRISLLSLDNRSDIRQSSIRTTTKVLEAASDQLTPAALNTCLLRLLTLCSSQVNRYARAVEEAGAPWQEAAIQTLTAFTYTSVHDTHNMRNANSFGDTWTMYLRVTGNMLYQRTIPMSSAVYKSLATMLQRWKDDDSERRLLPSESLLQMSLSHHPADISPHKESNQAALTDFAATLAAIFTEVTNQEIDHRMVVRAVQRTVLECVHPPYTSDTKKMAPEQLAVVALFPQLQRLLPGGAYTDLLQTFLRAPLAQAEPRTNVTFVALASCCSEILSATVTATLNETSEVPDVVPMLETLTRLIATKYTALPQGGAEMIWRIATTSAVQISQSAMQSKSATKDLPRMIAAFTALTTSILQADALLGVHVQDLNDNEAFDVASFMALHAAISPSIGDNRVPAIALKNYMYSLFHASLVAQPFYFDLPENLSDFLLEALSSIRPGTVRDPVYARRSIVCYKALDTLFALIVRETDMEQKALRLAQVAAPYVLLRCAYTFKTFMADQPLRSISALPLPLRVELLTVLNKCIDLRSARETFAGIAEGDNSDGKAHLRLLNSLVVQLEECWRRLPKKATGISWQDRKDGKEIEEALKRWRACLAVGWEIIN